jgi:hypothetical protein
MRARRANPCCTKDFRAICGSSDHARINARERCKLRAGKTTTKETISHRKPPDDMAQFPTPQSPSPAIKLCAGGVTEGRHPSMNRVTTAVFPVFLGVFHRNVAENVVAMRSKSAIMFLVVDAD